MAGDPSLIATAWLWIRRLRAVPDHRGLLGRPFVGCTVYIALVFFFEAGAGRVYTRSVGGELAVFSVEPLNGAVQPAGARWGCKWSWVAAGVCWLALAAQYMLLGAALVLTIELVVGGGLSGLGLLIGAALVATVLQVAAVVTMRRRSTNGCSGMLADQPRLMLRFVASSGGGVAWRTLPEFLSAGFPVVFGTHNGYLQQRVAALGARAEVHRMENGAEAVALFP